MNIRQCLLVFVMPIFLASCGEDEESLTLNEGKILNELHQQNIGKIAFMENFISFENFTQRDFKTSLVLTENSEMNMRLFLDKTITYHLGQLEPELTVRELCSKGNFQLTFYVDNKKIYEHNLPTGAGSCEYKNEQTVYGVPLTGAKEIDHWGRFLWVKFMKRGGGQKALASGNHTLKVEVRPYIDNSTLKVGELIAQGEVDLIRVDVEVDEKEIAIQTIAPTDNWELSNAQYNTEKIREVNKKIAQNYFKDITSIVVAKEGKLLIEEYFNGADRNTLHDTRSVGKSLASTVMGIAIEDGYLENEEVKLGQFYKLKNFENYTKKKEDITLKSLLTMSSGFDGYDMNPDSPGNEENMYPTADWVKFALDLPMDKEKEVNKDWSYFTAGAVILGDVLNQTVPNGLEKYADEKLFSPLGITNYTWQYTPTKVPNTAGGFQMNSLGNAKYGQLYLDKGKVNDTQVIPENWVESSLSKQISITEIENAFYGYLFWNKTYHVNDKSYEAYYASGNGGNKIMIFKELDLVIIITATAYGKPYMHFQVDEIIEDYILPAVIE